MRRLIAQYLYCQTMCFVGVGTMLHPRNFAQQTIELRLSNGQMKTEGYGLSFLIYVLKVFSVISER